MSRSNGEKDKAQDTTSQTLMERSQYSRNGDSLPNVAGSALGLTELLQVALDRIVEVTGATSGVVYTRLPDGAWELTASHNLPEQMKSSHKRITDDYPGMRLVIESDGPVTLSEWIHEPSRHVSPLNKESGMQSWAAVGISVRDNLFAVLGISSKEYNAFSGVHLQVMGVISELMSLALSNTVAHEQAYTQVDAQLRARVIELESVLASMSDGLLICDSEGKIVRANAAAAQITETPLDQLIGQSLLSERWNRAPQDSEQHYEPGDGPLAQALQGQAATNCRIQIEAGRQQCVLSVSVSPLQGSSGKPVGAVVVMRDITEEWQAQQSKEEFLGILSHELRAPLTVISGYAQFLGRKLAKQGMHDDMQSADLIREHALRMSSMIGDLVESGRLESGMQAIEKEPSDLAGLVQNVIRRMNTEQRYAKKEPRHTIEASIAPDLPEVHLDKGRIDQVLTNLLANAIKYGPDGGEITVRVEAARERTQVDGIQVPANSVLVSVTDQGVGIPPEEREHIFERGFRGARGKSVSSQGLGLGLYICRLAVDAHGGRIGVKDGPAGVGSTFWLTLPIE